MKRKYIYAILAAVIVIGGVAIKMKLASKEEHKSAVDKTILLNKTDVSTVQRSSISRVIGFTGDLSAKLQTIVSSEVDAKVLKVYVNEAQKVKSGTLLAKLDTNDLNLAVLQQEAQVDAAKSNYDLNLLKYKRQKDLYESGFISKLAFDELISNRDSSLQSYKAQLEQLKRAQKQLNDTNVVAPFEGVVYQRYIDDGRLVSKNTKLFAIANLDTMEIKTPINSDYIDQVKVGDTVSFTSNESSTVYYATVLRVNRVAEDGTRSFMVYADFDNRQANLKAGQFISGQIVFNTLDNQNIIPCDFIRSTQTDPSFVLILDNGKIQKINVSVVLKNNITSQCAVTNLQESQVIVSGNVLTVKPGDEVKVM